MEAVITVHEHLAELRACKVACIWAKQYDTAQEVWDNCDRTDWLFWWAARCGQVQGVVAAARGIAESVAHLCSDAADYAATLADDAASAAADYAAALADDAAAIYSHAIRGKDRAAAAADYAAAAAIDAADAATFAAKQHKLNLEIAHKHLTLPWRELEESRKPNHLKGVIRHGS